MERLLKLGGVAPRRRFTTVGGTSLHSLQAGSGRPLLLLQGAGGGAANWYRLFAALARFREVHALDLPGFGFSHPIQPERPLADAVARLIEGWLSEVGIDRCAVVATSFGSLAALRAAHLFPARMSRLVLLNGVGLGRELPLAVRLAGLPILGRMGARPSRSGTRWLLRSLLTRRGVRLPREHESALVEYLYASAAAGDPAWMARVYRLFGGWRGQREVVSAAQLGAVQLPVLVVWGALDPFLPVAHAQRAVSLIPRAVLRLLPRTGHSPTWECPDEVLRVVTPFLQADAA
jgi:pimeloyl-ACP methyl ester carboxylesterase